MSTNYRPESAKIYAFPSRRPVPTDGGRVTYKPVTAHQFQPICAVEFGSGWYHEAAVQDADRARKS